MLVLTRRKGETVKVKVGDVEVEIIVVKCDTGLTKIGFNAPQSVRILRGELQPKESVTSMTSSPLSNRVSKMRASSSTESKPAPAIDDMMKEWGIVDEKAK